MHAFSRWHNVVTERVYKVTLDACAEAYEEMLQERIDEVKDKACMVFDTLTDEYSKESEEIKNAQKEVFREYLDNDIDDDE